MNQALTWTALLCLCLAAGVLLHALSARVVKALIWSYRPLAVGEHEAFSYQRRVYHTAEPALQKVVALALAAGLLAWVGLISGYAVPWFGAFAALAGAVVLDLQCWERVTATANALWFQRGRKGEAHRIPIADIRDLAVDEEEADGWTLRNLIPGRRNVLCRLRIRLEDKRVVALPRTDARSGLAEVEAVANHLRLRRQFLIDKAALSQAQASAGLAARDAVAASSALDREMVEELKRLRRRALAPDE